MLQHKYNTSWFKGYSVISIKLHKRVEICGGIASGKTILANLLGRMDFYVVLHKFFSNPYLMLHTSRRDEFKFKLELSFLIDYLAQMKLTPGSNQWLACDTALSLNWAYAKVNLRRTEFNAFLRVYGEVYRQLSSPDILVHLYCSERQQIERIRRRGRSYELPLTEKYLKAVNRTLCSFLERHSVGHKLITINTGELDLATNARDQQFAIQQIQDAVLIAESMPAC